jgi:ribosomal protein S27E
MVVCAACRSTITKDADAARVTGHLSAVVEDSSAVRIGTRGRNGPRKFTVVGRLRMQYPDGAWNEWYLLFDDGTDGWLSDASGQYAVTRRLEAPERDALIPAYEDVRVGDWVKLNGVQYTVCDRRKSRCIGGEGELPIDAADGWESRAADLRRAESFATIDYTDDAPVVYVGTATSRTDFDTATLRSNEEVEAATGRYRGKVLPLDCPNCGGAITIVAAMATQVVCPSCSSLLDCAGARIEIIEANKRLMRFESTLPLGAYANFDAKYRVIGIMRCDVPLDRSEPAWTEYLLFNAQRGYLWLVETEDGWSKVRVSDEFPTAATDDFAVFRGRTWGKKYEYGAKVTDVVGAFNWRVRRGDVSNVVDYKSGAQTLTREQTSEEITYSLADPVHATQLATAFGKPELARTARKFTYEHDTSEDDDEETWPPVAVASMATAFMFVLSADLAGSAIFVGLLAIWAPLAFAYWRGESW